MRNSVNILLFLLLVLTFQGCNKEAPDPSYIGPPNVVTVSPVVGIEWATMTLYTIRFSAFNTPTYSSRSLGYMGLTMYESVVQGDPSHRSMSGQLNGLTLPLPEEGKAYHWVLSLNAAQGTLLKLLYPIPANSHRFVHERIDSLSSAIFKRESAYQNPETVQRSIEFGESIALAIYNWSVSDGGDKGYSKNFDPNFAFPSGPSYWVPPTRGQTVSPYPLHPYWGGNRTFVIANGTIPVPDIMPFSTDPTSEYYKMFKAVYDKNNNLTLAEKEIAAWWGDDPTETFSPPGHSYHIATIAVRLHNTNIVEAGETYARVGMAVADAFINCWKAKYTYFSERPSSFVNKYINASWVQFWPEPPFPAFPSGHSTNSAAAATVLTDLYGETFSFVDQAHQGHRRTDDFRFYDLMYPSRHFSSFWEAANESAYSRFLGGIHTKQDNDVGLLEGTKVGQNVNALQWTK